MAQVHSLTVRTTAALGRLAELQRHAEQVPPGSIPLVKRALRELSAALEELRVVNEELQMRVTDLAAARAETDEVRRRSDEFVQVMPVPCLWTDAGGVILEANEAAAALLNVARPRLAGKPLLLFLADRQPFFDALGALKAPGGVVELELVVRPRERRPRPARITARALTEDTRC